MKNIIYLGYFILKTDYNDLKKSFNCTVKKGKSRLFLIFDMLYNSLRYGTSFVDYFNFIFYEKTHSQKKEYATMGIMYNFHKKLNAKLAIPKVDDKKQFRENFKKYNGDSYIFTKEQYAEAIKKISAKIDTKIVVKDPKSTAGKGVAIYNIVKTSNDILVNEQKVSTFVKDHLNTNECLYFEDFIVQHNNINNISPTAVNTIRMITLITNTGEVEVIGSVFRISINCKIDNYSAGNLAAEIDVKTGIVISGGVIKRASCDKFHEIHPITKQPILGFKIPFWNEIINMIKEAALVVPEVRTIGWDVAITNDKPIIIEGNNAWNKDTWQIPAVKGKLKMIQKYL